MSAADTPGVLLAQVSVGELIDKITILEIKAERFADPAQRANVARELAALRATREAHGLGDFDGLAADLKAVNETLWQVEDDLRALEAAQDFGPRFVALARAVYLTNDRRAVLKREINRLSGSALTEEKAFGAELRRP